MGMRALFEAERSRAAGWAEAPAHQARVLSLYSRAATETSAFAELLAVLAVDPATGAPALLREDDIASRPGIGLLPPGWPSQLLEAAWTYLHQATPPGEDCLDHLDTWSLAAETGYLAFALLARSEAPDRTLPSLSSGILAAWAPAMLSIPVGTGHFDVKRILLTQFAQAVPDILPGLISRLLPSIDRVADLRGQSMSRASIYAALGGQRLPSRETLTAMVRGVGAEWRS
jgi:hypothetical protein